jgi:tol-pal system protein YbgF
MCRIKQSLILVMFFCFLFVTGCATKQDLRRVNSELDQKASTLTNEIESLKQESAALRKALDGNQEELSALRKTQAESNAEIAELKDRIRQLKGRTEEFQQELAAQQKAAQGRDQDLKDKIDRTSFKINFVENFLGIGKKDAAAEPADKSNRPANGRHKDTPNGKSDKETLYAAAYETFKEGKYEKARNEFSNYLKLHPRTEYSGNAQFWIGECYYNEQQYEKAILEYEKVVKEYPEGNKVPSALYKQGLAFLNLGDKASARLFLQQVIRDYPNTNQAKVARTKLIEIK